MERHNTRGGVKVAVLVLSRPPDDRTVRVF